MRMSFRQVHKSSPCLDRCKSKTSLHGLQAPLRLEKYLSPNFFGLFVGKREESALRALAGDLTRRLVKIGVADPDQGLGNSVLF